MDWLRWYHGTVSDPKWRYVAALSGATVGEVVAVWACVVEHASQTDPRGVLDGWRDTVYAMLLDMRPETVTAIRDAMEGLVIEGGKLTAWDKRQPTSTERVRRWRERVKRDETRETNATRMKRDETPETVDKIREDKIRVEVTTTDKAANAAAPHGTKKASRAKSLPAAWNPTDAHAEMASSMGVSIRDEVESFRDYHAAKGSLMKDWDAAFRTWLRNAARYAKSGKRVTAPPDAQDYTPTEKFQGLNG